MKIKIEHSIFFFAGAFVACIGILLYINQFNQSFPILKLNSKKAVNFNQSMAEWSSVKYELHRRFRLYHGLLKEQSTEDGMVVVKSLDGKTLHRCDSLLFTSLWYISTSLMNMQPESAAIWKNILRNNIASTSFMDRHPGCRDKSLSRDMLSGILASLSQNPIGAKSVLLDLVATLKTNQGSFDDGPFYVSYLSPQLALLLGYSLEYYDLSPLGEGISLMANLTTLDINSLAIPQGYPSHLMALSLWTEMEYEVRLASKGVNITDLKNGLFLDFNRALSLDKVQEIYKSEVNRIAMRLYKSNPSNLFYEFLYIKSSNLPIEEKRSEYQMLAEKLATMPQFPKGALPLNCDKSADYMWQRSYIEINSSQPRCTERYDGVDFLWMAAILLNEIRLIERDTVR